MACGMRALVQCTCPVRRGGGGALLLLSDGGRRWLSPGSGQGRRLHSGARLLSPPPPPTAFFFPGQGTQRVSMLSYLHRTFPRTISPLLELLDDTIAASDRGFPPPPPAPPPPPPPSGSIGGTTTTTLSTLIAAGPAARLTATENAQPAILFTSLCFLAVLQTDFGLDLRMRGGGTAGVCVESVEGKEAEVGVRQQGVVGRGHDDGGSGRGSGGGKGQLYFLGHSLGEFCALVAAGIMSLRDAITLVRRRGISMATSTPAEDRSDVGMYALVSPPEHLPDLIRTISNCLSTGAPPLPKGKIVQIANHNTSTQIVLSGHVSGIMVLLDHLRSFSGHDPRALRLNVSAPFHSQLMAPAVEVLQRELDGVELAWEGRLGEVVGNALARAYSGEQELRDMLPRQAVERVRWLESVRWLEEEKGVRRWIGFGPEVKVGRGLVKRDVCPEAEVVMVGEEMEISEWERVARLLEG